VDQPVIVLTTWPSGQDATAFAQTLVDEHLAACVSVSAEMQSIYRWKGAVEVEPERQLVIKTTESRLGGLEARLHGLHPYEVPEFLILPVNGGSERYLAWMRETPFP
jgi:periplasmic divalent cation tolerance protein